MTKLTNPKHELFARFMSRGYNQIISYQKAGFAANRGNASNLANNPAVMARIDELMNDRFEREKVEAEERAEKIAKSESLEELGLNRGWVLAELMNNVALSRESGNYNAANKALQLLGEELGMFKATQKKVVISSQSAASGVGISSASEALMQRLLASSDDEDDEQEEQVDLSDDEAAAIEEEAKKLVNE